MMQAELNVEEIVRDRSLKVIWNVTHYSLMQVFTASESEGSIVFSIVTKFFFFFLFLSYHKNLWIAALSSIKFCNLYNL